MNASDNNDNEDDAGSSRFREKTFLCRSVLFLISPKRHRKRARQQQVVVCIFALLHGPNDKQALLVGNWIKFDTKREKPYKIKQNG